MADLTGKGALVTGGSRGIGAAIVRRLAADGAAVAFTYAENKQAADAVAEESGALAIQADQADLARIGEVFRLAGEHAGGLDILVNNAGISPPTPILEATEETYDRLMAVNAKGPFFAIQEAGRVLQSAAFTALGRLGEPADIADVVSFLAGPDARWITGQNLRVTGGLLI